jgi:hypothetical protein
MEDHPVRRNSIIAGAILVVVGTCLLLVSLFPSLATLVDLDQQWPLFIIAVGGLFFAAAVLGSPPLAVPAALIGGLGLLLYVQNRLGAWESWSYAWTLIPGFVGVGLIAKSGLEGRLRFGLREGGRLVLISLLLFAVFGSFLGGLLSFELILPALLILWGVWLLARNIRTNK